MNSIDLTNLYEMIGDDNDMRRELFNEFMLSFESGLAGLAGLTGENQNAEWRKEAHALKGISYNLGAEPLGNLCKDAQDGMQLPANEKEKMLEAIRAEYAQVKAALQAELG